MFIPNHKAETILSFFENENQQESLVIFFTVERFHTYLRYNPGCNGYVKLTKKVMMRKRTSENNSESGSEFV